MSAQYKKAVPKPLSYHEALGMMMWLMRHADYHSQWPLWSVDKDIVPALIHGQSKLYFDDQRNPVGFATWAWLDDRAKEQALANESPLDMEQWNSGKNLMFVDFVAPWGHAKSILHDLKTRAFPESQPFSLGRHQNGSIRKIYYWKGIRSKSRIMDEQRKVNKKLWSQTD